MLSNFLPKVCVFCRCPPSRKISPPKKSFSPAFPDFIYFRNLLIALAPTAANVSVSGRILVGGRGLRNAVVFMIDANGNTRAARTSLFGYFRFENVEAGQSYVFQVNAKRFSFDPQVITINETLTELIFTAQPVYSYDKNSGKH